MTIEETIAALIDARLAPLCVEVRRLTAEIEMLRRALPPMLVPIREAAQMLRVSESTVRRHTRDGLLPVRRIGHSVRVDMSALRPLTDEEVEREAYLARMHLPRSR